MKQQVPTWLAVVIILIVVVIAGVVVWKKAGEKPIARFPEQGIPMHKGPMQKGPAPAPETQPAQPETQPK